MWTYAHAMLSRRVVTPLDLGFGVRDARMAVGLTQAELAEKAGVSREWLNGVERGKRPRAEVGQLLDVLMALDLPLMLGVGEPRVVDDDDEQGDEEGEEGETPGGAMSTNVALQS